LNHSSAVFISDLHLQASTPDTLAAFEAFCAGPGRGSEALFVLGDLFEAYVGDDDLADPANARIATALRAVHASGVTLYFMAGNRDFLVGSGFSLQTGATILPDPTLVTIGQTQMLLSHGDAWCTDDKPYQAFRAQSRNAAWQASFLAQPLATRRAAAMQMRAQSKAAKQIKSQDIMDVNLTAVMDAAHDAGVAMIVHGHTHRSAVHHHPWPAGQAGKREPQALERFVLSDWDFEGVAEQRGNALVIDAHGPRFVRITAPETAASLADKIG
jgi:UDP-2,3-diacylglucosamine hydrolase